MPSVSFILLKGLQEESSSLKSFVYITEQVLQLRPNERENRFNM